MKLGRVLAAMALVTASLGCGDGDDGSTPVPGDPKGDTGGAGDTGDTGSASTSTGDTGCTPSCGGKECGDDGCGGSCGPCADKCNGAADVPGLCIEGSCAHSCGDVMVKATYSGDQVFGNLTAFLYPASMTCGAASFDPAQALIVSPSVSALSESMLLSPVPASTAHVVVVRAKVQGGAEVLGCKSGVALSGPSLSVEVPLNEGPARFEGVYLLDSTHELSDPLPPSIAKLLASLGEMSDDHDLMNSDPNNGQYGQDPAAFLLDFVYREICCWEATGVDPDFDSCNDQDFTHTFGDLSAIYLQDFTTWMGAWPLQTGLCGALDNGVNELLQTVVAEVLGSVAPELAQMITNLPMDLANAIRHFRVRSELTLSPSGTTGSAGFSHRLISTTVTLHDEQGVAHEVDVDLTDAGLTALEQSGTATIDGNQLSIPPHAFQLELGKLVAAVYEKGQLPLLGYDSTLAMMQSWVDCGPVAAKFEELVPDFGFLDEEDYEKYCNKGLEEAADYVDDQLVEAAEGSTWLQIQGGAGGGETNAANVVLTLENGLWQGLWKEDGQEGVFTGTFEGSLKTP